MKLFGQLTCFEFMLIKLKKALLFVSLGLIGSDWVFATVPKLESAPEAKKQPVNDTY
jgi:hypothetical protein